MLNATIQLLIGEHLKYDILAVHNDLDTSFVPYPASSVRRDPG